MPLDFDPLALEFLADPFAVLAALPAESRSPSDGLGTSLAWGRPAPEEPVEHAENMAAYRGYLGAFVADRDPLRAERRGTRDDQLLDR